MSVSPKQPDLSTASLLLRNAAPEEWALFVRVVEAFTDEITVAVTDATVGEVVMMQGRARQCRSFLRTFKECDRPKPTPAAKPVP